MTVPTSRSTVLQTVQLGKEVTAGTIVAATKRFKGIDLKPSPNIPVKTTKYPGSKAAVASQRGQEWTDFSYTGVMDFNTLTYILSSMFGAVSPVVPAGGTAENDWIWTPPPAAPLTPLSFSIEQGSAKGAEKYGFGIFSGVSLTWNETSADMSGKAFGQKANRNATMTASLPMVPTQAVPPALVSVFVSADNVTYTKLTKDMEGELHFTDIWSPTFHVNDSNASFDAIHERGGDIGGTLTLEEGSESDTFLQNLEDGTIYYIGLKCKGAFIETVSTVDMFHTLRINMPVYITKPDPGDKNEVWGNTYTFEVADDGVALATITLANKLTAL